MSATSDAVVAALTPPELVDTAHTSTALIADTLTPWCEQLSIQNSGSLFERWRTHPAARGGWQERAWGTQVDERALQDLRGSEFGRLDVCRHRLAALAGAAAALGNATLSDDGRSPAVSVAVDRLGRFTVAVRAWQDGLTQLATALDGAHSIAADGLRAWVDELKSVSPKDITVDDPAKRTLQIARIDDAMNSGTLWGRTFPVDALRTPGVCDLNLAPGQIGEAWPSNEVINYLDDFCARYDAIVGKFRRNLRDVHEATARAWLTLGDLARAVDADPFAGLGSTASGSTGESVTIHQAGHAIRVTEPDADGRVALNVDGKQYVLGTQPEPAAQPAPEAVKGGGPAAEPGTGSAGAGGAGSGGAGSGGAGSGGGGGGAEALGGGGGGGGGAAGPATPPAEGISAGAQAPDDDAEKSRSGGAPAGGAAAGGAPPAGGAPMGGGMGGAGGGGQGGDSERKASKWRLAGTLFDDRDPMASFDGVVGEDPAARAKK
ncbi:hypothetical protein SAMN05192558_11318 [Actinokineospora alba]|uniref:Uncharacterized protein n=1 Tax=Actinokineospora alba TaxID=504798 RepID=A0A1H0V590_9PSEU|nr:hypothetical protein [Actinokineospora alba]TDP65470.1 hypothetical protein C8E96_0952 [Actinokineospora alba]SDH63087.1 hypothetical protein SAMN05421871_101772 [Actinokineospora alba]SDP73531.1 hypothetical protein SAMN05192558_11318 [Actinokineospora alba]